MRLLRSFIRNDDGAAAAEMMLVAPMLIILMFASVEMGNYFLTEHAVIKQVRDGARYASRLTVADPYSCTAGSDLSGVFADGNASTDIINVTKTGSVDGTAPGRFGDSGSAFWAACPGSTDPVSVSVRCVDKASYGGIYTTLDGDIAVVKVEADIRYPSLFGALGFNAAGLCMHVASESAVYGL